MKLNPVNASLVSDELYDKSIGMLNKEPWKYTYHYKNCIIHMIDSVSRGYITPMEAYDALKENYFPEFLKVRKSNYSHLI